MHSLLIVGLALCVTGCAKKEEPAPEPAVEPQAAEPAPAEQPAVEEQSGRDAEFIDHMHAHAEHLDNLNFALADDDLEVRCGVEDLLTPLGLEFLHAESGPEALEIALAVPEPAPAFDERRESVVVRVLVHQKMPEGHQAQLIRGLERQVSRLDPLIGWSDLYPVTGPLDLGGLDRFVGTGNDTEAGQDL